jgi:hypothetical protein
MTARITNASLRLFDWEWPDQCAEVSNKLWKLGSDATGEELTSLEKWWLPYANG